MADSDFEIARPIRKALIKRITNSGFGYEVLAEQTVQIYQAKKHDRVIDCLLQFHIAEEQTKFGLDVDSAIALLNSDTFKTLENIRLVSVMGMSTFTKNYEQVRREFKLLMRYFELLKNGFFKDQPTFKEVSMGMLGDYKIAIEEGSTMVRVGSLIFGSRA